MANISDTNPPTDHQDSPYGSLPSQFDVILCGTSLTNSILASALARAGYSVLHCDGADYYGELDAVWTLPYIVKEFEDRQAEDYGNPADEPDFEVSVAEPSGSDASPSSFLRVSPLGATQSLSLKSLTSRTEPEQYAFEEGTPVDSPYGTGVVEDITYSETSGMTRVVIKLDKWSANLYFLVPMADPGPDANGILARYAFEKHGVMHATCKTARQLLQQHSRAFALDVTPTLIYCSGPAVQGLLTSEVSEYLEFKTLQGMLFGKDLQVVPCNKSEVFASKLLKAIDKRRLMWFLQLAMDYAIAQEIQQETQDALENETVGADAAAVESLNERHLNQGRALRRPQNKPVVSAEIQALQRYMESGISFRNYLKGQKLSEPLIELVRYAMALENGAGGENETSLADAMHSLGQHLIALGRFGTTAFLATLYGSGELPQAFCRSAAVYGATYMLRTAVKEISWKNKSIDKCVTVVVASRDDQVTRKFACSHLVVSQQALNDAAPTYRVWRRTSVLSGKPVPGGQQRHVLILPPNTVADFPYVIQGILLDNGVNVAPHAPSNSLLHLTATVPFGLANVDTALESAALYITKSPLATDLLEEIFQVSFTYDLTDAVVKPAHSGIHLLSSNSPNLVADHAFEQARGIFESICPDVAFLTVAEKVTQTIEERLGSATLNTAEDSDEAVLSSAMMMSQSDKSAKTEADMNAASTS